MAYCGSFGVQAEARTARAASAPTRTRIDMRRIFASGGRNARGVSNGRSPGPKLDGVPAPQTGLAIGRQLIDDPLPGGFGKDHEAIRVAGMKGGGGREAGLV